MLTPLHLSGGRRLSSQLLGGPRASLDCVNTGLLPGRDLLGHPEDSTQHPATQRLLAPCGSPSKGSSLTRTVTELDLPLGEQAWARAEGITHVLLGQDEVREPHQPQRGSLARAPRTQET